MSHELVGMSTVPSLTYLCAHVDLTINVGKEDGTIFCRYRVFKAAMCLASPVWPVMLTGPFVEAEKGEVAFIDDDRETLLLVLRIAQCRMYEVPRKLTLAQIVNMATICDKYDTVSICRPFISAWSDPFLEPLGSTTQRFASVRKYLLPGNVEILWFAHVFGQTEFIKLSNTLRFEVSTHNDGSCIMNPLRQQNLLESTMPSGIIGRLHTQTRG